MIYTATVVEVLKKSGKDERTQTWPVWCEGVGSPCSSQNDVTELRHLTTTQRFNRCITSE